MHTYTHSVVRKCRRGLMRAALVRVFVPQHTLWGVVRIPQGVALLPTFRGVKMCPSACTKGRVIVLHGVFSRHDHPLPFFYLLFILPCHLLSVSFLHFSLKIHPLLLSRRVLQDKGEKGTLARSVVK